MRADADLTVHVSIPNAKQLVARMRHFREDQIPFALSLGMNRAALDARQGYAAHMEKVFKLRRFSFAKIIGPFGELGGGKSRGDGAGQARRAIRRGWSHRLQWPHLEVEFIGLAHAHALQEQGGEKPFRGAKSAAGGGAANPRGSGYTGTKRRSKHVWIPTEHVPRDGSGIAQRFEPARIRKRLNAKRTGARATNVVFQRGNSIYLREFGERRAKRLYVLAERAVVPPRFELTDYILRTYRAKLWPRFSQAMASAMARARDNRFTGKKVF